MGRHRDYSYLISPEGLEIEIVEKEHSSFPPDLIRADSSFEVIYDGKVTYVDPVESCRVRFAESNDYITVHNLEDLSANDRKAMWFRKSELRRFRKKQEGGEWDKEEEQSLGTKALPTDDLQEALHQITSVAMVLEEQTRQRNEGLYDPYLLSWKYQGYVRRARHSVFISNLLREQEKTKKRGRPLKIITDGPVFTDIEKL